MPFTRSHRLILEYHNPVTFFEQVVGLYIILIILVNKCENFIRV